MKQRIIAFALCLIALIHLGGHAAPPPAALDPALGRILRVDPHRLPGLAQAASLPTGVPRYAALSLSEDAEPRVELFLEARGNLPEEPGDVVLNAPGGVTLARVPVSRVRDWLDRGLLERARLARPVHLALDRSTQHVGASAVRSLTPEGSFAGVTGKGVLVGVVDGGLDLSHPDFSDHEGLTRLVRYWDQRALGGRPTVALPFGEQWDARQINSLAVRGTDTSGHGTHVAGIAAGNGRGGWQRGRGEAYVGMAPEARLVAVRSNLTEFGVAYGVRYIFERADEIGLPAVVNLSLGNHFGPHAGTTPFERALEAMVGPGRIIVAAAGNDAHRDFHARMDPSPGVTEQLQVRFPRYVRDPEAFFFSDIEGWFSWKDTYRFTIRDPQGDVVGVVEKGMEREFVHNRGIVRSWYLEDDGWGSFLLEIEDNPLSVRLSTGTWKVDVEALDRASGEPLDFWVVNWRVNTDELPRFESHADPAGSVIVPATAARILATGAVATRACWNDVRDQERCYGNRPDLGGVAFFSSYGPTRDLRKKPELLAPGFGVVSCRSSSIDPSVWPEDELDELSVPGELYWLSQGTSMAAPHVSGAVALLLERFPDLTPEQVAWRLVRDGQRITDPRTGSEEVVLDIGRALAPPVRLAASRVVQVPEGNRIEWEVETERTAVAFRVLRSVAGGPEHELSRDRLTGGNPYALLDSHVEAGRHHLYRIVAEDPSGVRETLAVLESSVAGTPVPVFRAPDPNPARGSVSLRFGFPPTPAGGEYTLEVVGVQGRLVRRLGEGAFTPEGIDLRVGWDQNDDLGQRVPSGIYFIRLAYTLHRSAPGVSSADLAGYPEGTQTLVRRVVTLP